MMGAILRFNEEGRALFVARALADKGHAVEWTHALPSVVRTSASRKEARVVAAFAQGVDSAWWSAKAVKVERRNGGQ